MAAPYELGSDVPPYSAELCEAIKGRINRLSPKATRPRARQRCRLDRHGKAIVWSQAVVAFMAFVATACQKQTTTAPIGWKHGDWLTVMGTETRVGMRYVCRCSRGYNVRVDEGYVRKRGELRRRSCCGGAPLGLRQVSLVPPDSKPLVYVMRYQPIGLMG